MPTIFRDKSSAVTVMTDATPLKLADCVCSAAFAVLLGLSVALVTGKVDPMVLDFTGIAFLIAAFTYQGSARTWWMWLMPVALAALVAPIAIWESMGTLDSPAQLFSLAALPALSLIGGGLLATFRDTVRASVDGRSEIATLTGRLSAGALELARLDHEVAGVIDWVSEMEPGGSRARLWEAIEIRVDDLELFADSPWENILLSDLDSLIRSEMDRLSGALRERPKVRISYSSQRETPLPIAIRARRDVIAAVVRGLVGQSINGLVAGRGAIRVSLRPGLGSVALLFEDNGRGLSEAFIHKLDEKGVLSRLEGQLTFREIRELVARVGGTLELRAKLGAGSRITVEFPRVDGFAPSRSVIKRREEPGPILTS